MEAYCGCRINLDKVAGMPRRSPAPETRHPPPPPKKNNQTAVKRAMTDYI